MVKKFIHFIWMKKIRFFLNCNNVNKKNPLLFLDVLCLDLRIWCADEAENSQDRTTQSTVLIQGHSHANNGGEAGTDLRSLPLLNVQQRCEGSQATVHVHDSAHLQQYGLRQPIRVGAESTRVHLHRLPEAPSTRNLQRNSIGRHAAKHRHHTKRSGKPPYFTDIYRYLVRNQHQSSVYIHT